MPVVALSITKRTTFQGASEEFSNVYTLDSGVDFSNDWSAVANDVADLEKAIMSQQVTFVSYRVWNIGGTPSQNVIIDAGDLTGTGSQGAIPPYKECAVLIRWPLTRSPILRRRRWLSKWLHCVSLPLSSASEANGTLPISQADRDRILANYAVPLGNGPGGAGAGVFFTDGLGERPGDPEVFEFLEHRQFHHG